MNFKVNLTDLDYKPQVSLSVGVTHEGGWTDWLCYPIRDGEIKLDEATKEGPTHLYDKQEIRNGLRQAAENIIARKEKEKKNED